jgi:anti-sigma factor RsiW
MTHAEAVASAAADRYLLDEMPPDERDAFEAHYFACAECADDVRTGSTMRAGVKAGLMTMPATATGAKKAEVRAFEPPTKNRPPLVRPPTFLPWAAAAALALLAGYQSLIVIPGMRRGLEPQALAPVTLRPASRGAEPVVRIPAEPSDRQAIALAVDIASPAAGMTYDLRTSAGGLVASGPVAPPPPGTPVVLLLPASMLRANERYVLAVRAGSNGPPLDEFRFAVTSE